MILDGAINSGLIIENDPNEDLQSLDVPNGSFTGTVSVASAGSIVVGGGLGGTVAVSGPVGSIAVSGSITASVSVQSAGRVTVGQDLSGTVTASQSLGPVSVTAAVSGVISAPTIASVSAGSVAASGEVTASQSLGALNVSGPSLGTIAAPNLSVLTVSGTGIYGGTATVSAKLTLQGGTPMAGQTVAFSLNLGGSTEHLGSATTGRNGVATLTGVELTRIGAGTYIGAVTAYFAGGSGVLPGTGSGGISVAKATLTVMANNATRLYGAASPTFTVSDSGFVNNDSASVLSGSPSLTTTATVASPVGSYPITVAQGSLAAANYTFAFVNGLLTITSAAGSIYLLDPTAGGAADDVGQRRHQHDRQPRRRLEREHRHPRQRQRQGNGSECSGGGRGQQERERDCLQDGNAQRDRRPARGDR